MFTPYNLLKFVHVAAAMVWVGGVVAMMAVTLRVTRGRDFSAMSVMVPPLAFLGQLIIGPSALITVLAGFGAMGVGKIPFPLWAALGLAGAVASLVIGAAFTRRSYLELATVAGSSQPDGGQLDRVRRRIGILGFVNLLLLLSTVWAMVFKPSL